jgi:putative copper export protein
MHLLDLSRIAYLRVATLLVVADKLGLKFIGIEMMKSIFKQYNLLVRTNTNKLLPLFIGVFLYLLLLGLAVYVKLTPKKKAYTLIKGEYGVDAVMLILFFNIDYMRSNRVELYEKK